MTLEKKGVLAALHILLILALPPALLSAQEKNAALPSPSKASTALLDHAVAPLIRAQAGFAIDFSINTPFTADAQGVEVSSLADWPAGIDFSPYYKSSYLKNRSRLLRLVYPLRFPQSGVYQLGPFSIRQGNEVFQTLASTVIVMQDDERKRTLPLILSWSEIPSQLYLGQSLLVHAKLHYASELAEPEWLRVPRASGALFERVSTSNVVPAQVIEGQNSYHVPLMSWLLTPSQVGMIELSPGQISYQGLLRSLPPRTIEVVPLPPDLHQSTAIGDFSIEATLKPERVRPGADAILTIQLQGEGNLHYLRMPQPQSAYLNFARVDEKLQAIPAPQGYRGSKTVSYRISQENQGDYPIRIPPFRWLQQDGSSYQQNFGELVLRVSTNFYPSFGHNLLGNKQLEVLRLQVFWLRWGWLLLLLPALLLPPLHWLLRAYHGRKGLPVSLMFALWLLGSFIVYQRASSNRHQATVAQAQLLFDQGEHRLALSLYQYLVLNQPRDAGYRINQAIILYQLGSFLPALTQLYQSQQLLTHNALVQDGLVAVKEKLLLTAEPEDWPIFFNPIYLEISIITLTWLLAGMFLLQRPRAYVLSKVFTMLSLLAITLLLLWPTPRHALTGSKGAFLYRVPSEAAQNSLPLKAGERVALKGYQNDRFLVKTANGKLGWVEQDRLVLLNYY